MKETALTLTIYIVLLLTIWGLGTWFSNRVSTYEIIQPEANIKCVVVSRMFNTSVDCWNP